MTTETITQLTAPAFPLVLETSLTVLTATTPPGQVKAWVNEIENLYTAFFNEAEPTWTWDDVHDLDRDFLVEAEGVLSGGTALTLDDVTNFATPDWRDKAMIPPVGTRINVRTLGGRIEDGVITGRSSKDGRPVALCSTCLTTRGGETMINKGWVWPEQIVSKQHLGKHLAWEPVGANSRGLHIQFTQEITPEYFDLACQMAIDLAKIECAAERAVAVNFVAQDIPVQVTECDCVLVQRALWQRKQQK